MLNTKEIKKQKGLLPSVSTGIKAALIYVMLFVAFMLMVEKTMTAENLGLPAGALFLVLSGCDYTDYNSRKRF